MAAQVNGVDDFIELSDDGGVTFKYIICEESNELNMTRNVTRTSTKCDGGVSVASLGAMEWNASASIVVDTAPASNQASYKQLSAWMIGGTPLIYRNRNPVTGLSYYHSGAVYITSLGKASVIEDVVKSTIELSGTGALDYVP